MFGKPHQLNEGWILKGGYALELRFRHARATKDLDLTVRTPTIEAEIEGVPIVALLERPLTAALLRLPDFFMFDVGEAMLTLDQAPEGGFPVAARLDGRSFAKFHGEDWLGFAGIAPVAVPALSVEQHWAEKLHAYTHPRDGRINTRVKDLIDLVVQIERETLASDRVIASVDARFSNALKR